MLWDNEKLVRHVPQGPTYANTPPYTKEEYNQYNNEKKSFVALENL